MITSYVFCVDCRCSVHDWIVYTWHADQGHALSWNNRPAAVRQAEQ